LFVPAVCLLPATFLLPELDLESSTLALAAYAVTETGGKAGLPWVGALCFALVLSRPGLTGGQRSRELVALLVSIGLVLGAAAWTNEHVVKAGFAVPRPCVRELVERGVLDLDADAFYRVGDKDARRAYLAERLTPEVAEAQRIHPLIAAHWAHETGFSFPSGHSLGSMSFASAFVALGLFLCRGWRRTALMLLPLWGLGVCFSRPMLRVHSPTDVSVGGLCGVLLGLAVFGLAVTLRRRLLPDT
jgi:phosphatidylglycerophosphatase B